MGFTKSVLYLVYSIYWKLLFSLPLKDYGAYLSKHVSIIMQIDHNGFFKRSKYTIL